MFRSVVVQFITWPSKDIDTTSVFVRGLIGLQVLSKFAWRLTRDQTIEQTSFRIRRGALEVVLGTATTRSELGSRF